MKYIYLLLTLLIATQLSAKVLINPIEVMKLNYGSNVVVEKENILLKNREYKKVKYEAKADFKSRIFKVFKASRDTETLAYGILINRKVRSKNAVVMYIISADATLRGIEVIAFNEPMEYLPSKKWNIQFENISVDKKLRLSKDIATITGATLSARTITDGSRIAFAFYNERLRGR